MANAIYNKGREAFLNGQVNWGGDTIKAVLVDLALYTFSATHQFLSDIPSGARASISAAFASKSSTDGVADAADITFASVPAGSPCGAVVIFKDTGTVSTSPLLVFLDTGYTGLPVTPNNGDIGLQWPNDANKIFKL